MESWVLRQNYRESCELKTSKMKEPKSFPKYVSLSADVTSDYLKP